MHPEGTFSAVVVEHGLTKASTGTPQVCVKVETEHGFLTGFLPLTDRAAANTMKALRAMGFPGNDISALNDEPSICQGNEVEVVVEHEVWKGKTSARIAWINAPGSAKGMAIKRDATAAAVAKKFNAMLKNEPVVETKSKDDDAPAGGVGKDGIPF